MILFYNTSRSYLVSCVSLLNMGLDPANTKHLYEICTMLELRRRRWTDIVQMLYKSFVFAGRWAENMEETNSSTKNENLSPKINGIFTCTSIKLLILSMASALWLQAIKYRIRIMKKRNDPMLL